MQKSTFVFVLLLVSTIVFVYWKLNKDRQEKEVLDIQKDYIRIMNERGFVNPNDLKKL